MNRIAPLNFLLKLNPLLYSFFGGVFVSIAANVFTGIYGSDSLPSRSTQLLTASGLLFFAGSFWVLSGHIIEQLQREIDSETKVLGRARRDVEADVFSAEKKPYITVLIAFIFSIAGLMALIPTAPDQRNGIQDTHNLTPTKITGTPTIISNRPPETTKAPPPHCPSFK